MIGSSVRRIGLGAALLATLTVALSTRAADVFVAPDGVREGNGSKGRPVDLDTALEGGDRVKPGDTVWLRGGTYSGAFKSRLKGTEAAPITVRAMPGERVTIDCSPSGARNPMFTVQGQWTIFWGLEITSSPPKRVTKTAGSSPDDIRRGGINCRGANITLVNLVIHDTDQGLGFWGDGEGGEVYGCVIYNNGWIGPERGHGHAIYAQNKTGAKRLVDNILGNQFGYGIHVYGEEAAFLSGFHIEGNIAFNNGLPANGSQNPNILVGGDIPADRIALIDNCTYHAGLAGQTLRLGYSAPNKDLLVRGNYFAGLAHVMRWAKINLTGNTFIAAGEAVQLEPPAEGMGQYAWDHNSYFSEQPSGDLFRLAGKGSSQPLAWKQWTSKTGFDAHSQFTPGRPTGVKVFVRPNRYEPGRANLAVYNWDHAEAIELDLKGVLSVGQQFRIVSAQDFYGLPVLKGRYEGKPVSLSMSTAPAATPRGLKLGKLIKSGPEFGAFVVLPE